MLWFVVLAVWCASGYVLGLASAPAHGKPYYPAATHARHFAEFKATYNKQYATPEEERMRFEIFKDNLNDINRLNSKFKETVYGINNFSDMTTKEVIAQHTGLVTSGRNIDSSLPPSTIFSTITVPESFDWRDKNVVTRVRNEGLCRASWAFATIEDNLPFWNLKLSWGEGFGEKGYVKIYWGTQCLGLSSKGSSPSVITVEVEY